MRETEYLKEWLICITLCCIGCSLVYVLAPRGAMEKTMKTVISLFIIAAMFSPLTQLTKGTLIKRSAEEITYEYAEQVNSALLSASQEAVRLTVYECLPELDNGVSVIDVSTGIDGENTVCVESVTVRLNGASLDAGEIKDKIYEKLKVTAEVMP